MKDSYEKARERGKERGRETEAPTREISVRKRRLDCGRWKKSVGRNVEGARRRNSSKRNVEIYNDSSLPRRGPAYGSETGRSRGTILHGEEAELFFSYSLDSSSWRSSPIGIRRAPVDRSDVFRNKARNFRSRTICARKEPIPFSFFLSFLSRSRFLLLLSPCGRRPRFGVD